MTCIVGLVDNGDVYIGADSAGVGGWSITARKDPKVFRVGEFVMGFTSSFRMGQLLNFKLTPPEIPSGMPLYEYMVKHFVEEVRKCLKEGGYAEIKENRERGGTFLVGVRSSLFQIYEDYQVAEALMPYAACGCGDELAMSSLYTSQENYKLNIPKISAKKRIMLALTTAETFSAGVCGPFTILSTGDVT